MRMFLGWRWLSVASWLAVAGAGLPFTGCSDNATASGPGADGGVDGASVGPGDPVCPVVAARTCTAAACTTQLGEPAVCVADACVKLKTADCPRVGGAFDDDDAIVIGVVHSNRGANKASGETCNNAIELAVNEINLAGGLPSADKCTRARKFAYVACDDTTLDAAGTTTAAALPDGRKPREASLDHLAGELKVPVVVGGVSSGDVQTMAKYVIEKHRTMFFTTRGSSNFLKEPEKILPATSAFNASPDGVRLFWRGTQNVEIQGKAMKLAYAKLEAELKAAGRTTVKLAVIQKNEAYGQGLGQIFTAGLLVNGVAGTAETLLVKTYKVKTDDAVGELQADVLAALKIFQPDVMVHIGTDEIIGVATPAAGFVAPYEDFARSLPANKKPYYLGAHGLHTASLNGYVDNVADGAQKTGFRARTRGTFPGRTTQASQDFFNFRFKPAYANAALIPGVLEGYDITFILGYTMTAALAKGPITSRSIVENMDSILAGTEKVSVGPIAFDSTAKRVAGGAKIDLEGVFSTLKFDPRFGEAPSDTQVWCVGIDPNTSKAFFNEATGQYYDAAADNLVGAFACP